MRFRGLTIGELAGAYWCGFETWFCGLRGHRWGPWYIEAPDFSYGPATRMCEREGCYGYEHRETP